MPPIVPRQRRCASEGVWSAVLKAVAPRAAIIVIIKQRLHASSVCDGSTPARYVVPSRCFCCAHRGSATSSSAVATRSAVRESQAPAAAASAAAPSLLTSIAARDGRRGSISALTRRVGDPDCRNSPRSAEILFAAMGARHMLCMLAIVLCVVPSSSLRLHAPPRPPSPLCCIASYASSTRSLAAAPFFATVSAASASDGMNEAGTGLPPDWVIIALGTTLLILTGLLNLSLGDIVSEEAQVSPQPQTDSDTLSAHACFFRHPSAAADVDSDQRDAQARVKLYQRIPPPPAAIVAAARLPVPVVGCLRLPCRPTTIARHRATDEHATINTRS